MTQLLIDTEFLDDPEGLIEEIWGSGDEYYCYITIRNKVALFAIRLC